MKILEKATIFDCSTVFSNLGYSTEEMSELDSLVYVRNQQIKIRSDAILSILFDLGGIYRMSAIFYLTPKFFRDAIYDQIASRRYQGINLVIFTKLMVSKY